MGEGAGGATGPADDVSAVLAELERKLRELERELDTIVPPVSSDRAETDPIVAPPSLSPESTGVPSFSPGESPFAGEAPPPDEAGVRLIDEAAAVGERPPRAPAAPSPLNPAEPGLAERLEALLRFREQLERSGRELVDEYGRLLDGLQAWVQAPSAGAVDPSDPFRDALFDRHVRLDARPFAGIDALAPFEARLTQLDGVQQARLVRFEGDQAQVALDLDAPATLVRVLRQGLARDFQVTEAAPDHLSIVLDSPPATEGPPWSR